MATNSSVKNQIANKNQGNNSVNPNSLGLKQLLATPTMKKKFEDVLDSKAPQFMSSLLNLYSNDSYLQKAEPMSVVTSALVAATLDLPIDKNLGYAWVVPYSGKAQFQMGYKGFIQLALRTGQYRNINVIEVYEGELQSFNRLTEEIELDFEKKLSDKVIGYTGFFELLNGFRKTVYWSKEDIEKHKKRFSKSDFGWKKDWDAMAKKTVIRNLLNKWGILSIDMQKGMSADGRDAKEINVSEDGEIIDIEVNEVDDQNETEINFDENAQ
ncbi:recombinase RecT [Virgibacillus sp. M23]|uniref:recombinase RecT n=1 Tax=Virgibacillus sp. M23 TaxID=3079030 RepID=UPI002A909EBA|nr:recombinase RecT [Virgibacillus sp. M23]MDY7044402.1 recombinase RecT [Virgibacillus sp. M23]